MCKKRERSGLWGRWEAEEGKCLKRVDAESFHAQMQLHRVHRDGVSPRVSKYWRNAASVAATEVEEKEEDEEEDEEEEEEEQGKFVLRCRRVLRLGASQLEQTNEEKRKGKKTRNKQETV